VIEAAAKAWREKIPNINLIVSDGFLDEKQQQQWSQTLQKVQPVLILVGLGIPRQEYWIRDHRQICPQAVWIGVGGSFDIWSGTKKRAPRLLRDNNLEWLYRLYQEPWRWRRMLVLPAFLLRCFLG
jgi:N-acetylglucosaminyldiphosphoundecaprenol N-acetyl-beta-D-mannosaminyltransferase